MLRAAASVGLNVAPQGTGHGAPPLAGRLRDAVLLRTSAMTELRVDAARRTARVGAGALWGDVVERAGRVHLAALHTSSPGVGVVGSSLGGGLSWYARQHGLQCSAITAVELVLADGTFVRATDQADSDLLWAARGGGGGFGVVTALEFDLFPVSTVYAGKLAWDWSHAQRVLTAWGEWAASAPESVTSVARLFQAPDLPWLPADVRGRKLVIVDAVVLAGRDAATRVLAPLRALRPEVDTFDECSAASVADLQLDPTDADSGLREQRSARRPARTSRGRAGRDSRPRVGVGPALRRAASARRSIVTAGPARRGAGPYGRLGPGPLRGRRRGRGVGGRARGRQPRYWTPSSRGPPNRRTS